MLIREKVSAALGLFLQPTEANGQEPRRGMGSNPRVTVGLSPRCLEQLPCSFGWRGASCKGTSFYESRALGEGGYCFVAKYSATWGKLSVSHVPASENLWKCRGCFHVRPNSAPKSCCKFLFVEDLLVSLFILRMKNSLEKH